MIDAAMLVLDFLQIAGVVGILGGLVMLVACA